ncbi:hypothetical protein B0G81_7687 [Paraburkholderia sp. BL6665CI2N2]|uniref:hypothetical protein n=1 Tax=Paraburkholderia sp. BL6665CI2N2 TaxID=1938806 RepID=UPI001064EE14|nr:hypothetical protein [Paraburkholderia sp. BL6665CI2N2]TDY27139.1 hypothetical protein B0G81_7687 [Paraburkholderia sp. BL6665CI2N2]
MPTFNPAYITELVALLSRFSRAGAGKTLGDPAYYAGRKRSIYRYEQTVAVKLPNASAEKLLAADRDAEASQTVVRSKKRKCIQRNVGERENSRANQPVFEGSIRYVLAQLRDATS